jgi:acetyl esterase/lipase
VLRDVAYGRHPLQRMDVYLPAHPRGAPVIFMVHGGGWSRGDKAMGRVVDAKVERWLPRGFIVISANYRMLPEADPLEQARDIARAVAAAQRQAAAWGGDRTRFVLMGHSAGAHLIALLAASPTLYAQAGALRPLGFVILDSAALDVVALMQAPHFPLYDRAFGPDPAFWRSVSPLEAMRGPTQPMLLVCSSPRAASCAAAHRFARAAVSLGTRASVLEEDLSHGEINQDLGAPGDYTDAVESFMAGLDPSIGRALTVSPGNR